MGGPIRVTSLISRAAGRAGVVCAVALAATVSAGTAMAIRDGNRVKSLDEPAYLDLAENLVHHGAFAHTNTPEIEGYDPALPRGALRPTAYRPPGYPWVLAAVRWPGGGYPALRALNSLLLALTLWSLYALLRRRAGPVAALTGVALVLCYPVLPYAAGTLYPQTLAALLLVLAFGQLDGLQRSSPWWRFLLAGLLWGALVVTVPVCLALLPIAAGWLLWSARGRGAQVTALVLAAAAPAALWSARNTAVFGAPCGVATSSGFNLLAGNGPYVRYDQATADLRWPGGVRDRVRGKTELERDRIMTAAAVQWMREDVGRAATLYAQKLLYWFSFRNRLVSDRVVPGGSGAGPPPLRDLAMLVGYGLLAAILLVRLALMRRHPLSPPEILALALYVGAALAYAVYFPRIRFRLPFDWLLIAIDSMFVARVVATVSGGALPGTAPTGAAGDPRGGAPVSR